jgi:hypothetical protein
MDAASSHAAPAPAAESPSVASPAPGKSPRTVQLKGAPGAPSAAAPAGGSESAAGGAASDMPDPYDFSFISKGSEAGPLDSGIRLKAEQSLGGDFGDVRVHQGAEAAQANRELGSTAFAHGGDVVLGAGASNSANPVMAHELAHVAQQRGATPGVAMKSERGASGSGHEVEADQAAAAIMIGAPASISQVGAERIMCFEGAEHMELGNAAYGGQKITIGKVTLPAGAFTALQGDFFGDFKEMERACHDNPKLMYSYYDVLVKEGKARDLHQQGKGEEPDSNGPIMVASALNGRNPMDYLDLAAKNFNHFSEQNGESKKMFGMTAAMNPAYAPEIADASGKFGHNVAQWLKMHLEAARTSFQDGVQNKELGGVGVAMDASALHYLTDAFAAGHMRVPRMEMYNEYQTTFRTAARKFVDKYVDKIPNEIDVKAFITQAAGAVGDAAGSAVSTARSYLPDFVNSGIDMASDAAHKGAALAGQGADALGISMPSIPELKISLAGIKTALKAKLHPMADTIGDFAGEKIAGFSAKVLHDYDNEHGVEVHNDSGKTWTAKGDHALADSPENVKIAKQCAGASAKHIKDMHAQGKAHAGDAQAKKDGLTMPFVSLKPIFGLLPQVSPEKMKEKTGPGEERDWHWKTMNGKYRAQILENAKSSIKDTASSAWAGIKDAVRETVEAKVKELVSALGQFASMLASKIGAIVDKIMSYIPEIDPEVLVAGMLAVGP